MKKVLTLLAVLLLMTVCVSCDKGGNTEDDPPIDGGYRSKNYETSPLGNIEGSLVKLETKLIDEYTETFKIEEENGVYRITHTKNGREDSQLIDKLSSEWLGEFIKTCGINRFNGFDVFVNGVPDDAGYVYCSADYSSGEHLFFEGNAGNEPADFRFVYNDMKRYLLRELGDRSDIEASLGQYRELITNNNAVFGVVNIDKVEGPFDSFATVLNNTGYWIIDFFYDIDFGHYVETGLGQMDCVIPYKDDVKLIIRKDGSGEKIYEGDGRPIFILHGDEDLLVDIVEGDMVFESYLTELNQFGYNCSAKG